MLTKLSPEQEALIPIMRDEWLAHGLSTEPADRAEAEAGMLQAYELAGLKPPARIVWAESPLAGNRMAAEAMGCSTEQSLREAHYGQHDAGWLAYYAFFLRAAPEITGPEKLLGLMRLAKSAGWYWTLDDLAIICERPHVLHRDENNDLHHRGGPAMAWRDGFEIHAWHGLRVPADMWQWSCERILQEQNAEIRRCAIEAMGWPEFVAKAGLTRVGEAMPDPGNPGQELTLYDLPEQVYDEPVRVLICDNGTVERGGVRRRFGLTVPGDCENALEAAAWTYGLKAAQYQKMVRRT